MTIQPHEARALDDGAFFALLADLKNDGPLIRALAPDSARGADAFTGQHGAEVQAAAERRTMLRQ